MTGSLESVPSLDLEAVVAYALRLRSATLAAKVGWFLELNAKRLDVPERAIRRLRSRVPKSRQYLDRGWRRGHWLASGWNLMLPTPLAERRWSGEAWTSPASGSGWAGKGTPSGPRGPLRPASRPAAAV